MSGNHHPSTFKLSNCQTTKASTIDKPEWNSADTLGPDGLVQASIDPDVLEYGLFHGPIECVPVTDLGSHLLLSKLLDLLDSPGRLVLEPDPVQPLVHVDGVLTGDDLHI